MLFKRRIQDTTNGPTTYVAASTKIVGTITGKGAYVFAARSKAIAKSRGR